MAQGSGFLLIFDIPPFCRCSNYSDKMTNFGGVAWVWQKFCSWW